MEASSTPAWSFDGDYFENCNCAVACPCVFSTEPPFASAPTEGACEVAFAFHIDHGTYGDVPLDNLNVCIAARTPGPMIEGNWSIALYVDERADKAQQDALHAIFSGQAGGTMSMFAPLIGEVLGMKTVPIAYRIEDKHRSVEIPDVMHLAIHPIASIMGADAEMVAVNAHPFAPQGVVMAVGDDGSTWSDFGLHWDNSGRNGHYAPVHWSNR